MPSRYNQILPNQDYVSTHIPLPLEGMLKMGQMKQDSYDTTKGALEKSLLESRLKSIEEHDPYRNQYIKSFNDQAQALLGDQELDFGSSSGKQKVSNLIYENANNPYLQTLTRSIKNKEDQLKNIEDVKKTKDGYSYWNDPILQENRMKEMGINPYIDKDGNPIEYQFRPMQTREDHNKPVYDLFDKIKDSGEIKAYADLSGDKQYISTGKGGWEGVSAGTIKAVADSNINTFKTSAGGQDFLKKFEFDYGNQLAEMSPEEAEQARNLAVKSHLYEIGNAYIRNKTTQDKDLKTTHAFDKAINQEGTGDPWVSFTPQQPGQGTDTDSRLTNGLPTNIKKTMMYKDGKLVSKTEDKGGFWSTLWSNVTDAATAVLNPSSAPKIVAERAARIKVDTKHAIESNKEIKPLLLNYGIATGKLKSEQDLNDPKVFNKIKQEYGDHLADAIIANREVLFDQTTADHATDAILPTADKDGNILNPNMMGSLTIYSLDGKIIDDQALSIGGKLIGPDTKNPGRLLMGSRDGKQYSVDPNIPDLKLVTQNISDFDRAVIERVATGAVTNGTESLTNYYSAISGEIDKINADPKVKENIKLNYIGKINSLVGSGYKMSTAYYGGDEVPIAIRYNPDGSVEKKVIAEVDGRGATIMDIGEYKSYKTQESFRSAGILPQLNDKSDKQYEAKTIR